MTVLLDTSSKDPLHSLMALAKPKTKKFLDNYFHPSTMQWPTECLKFCWGHSNKGSLNKQVLLLYVAKLGGSTSPHVPVQL